MVHLKKVGGFHIIITKAVYILIVYIYIFCLQFCIILYNSILYFLMQIVLGRMRSLRIYFCDEKLFIVRLSVCLSVYLHVSLSVYLSLSRWNKVWYYSNQKTESIVVFSMPENPCISIFMRFKNFKIFTKFTKGNNLPTPFGVLAEIMFYDITRKLWGLREKVLNQYWRTGDARSFEP